MSNTHIIRFLRSAALAIVLLLATSAIAMAEEKAFTVGDVPNVHLSDARQYVSDPSGILSASARDSINTTLARLERQTGIETAVVMLPDIGDADIFDFAHELFRQWGIGKKKSDNGLLFLFVMSQHKIRITTGYGLEATLTDALSKRIQTRYMVPRFKEGDWDGGMMAGVKAAAQVLDGSMQPEPDESDDDGTVAIVALGIIVLIVIFVIYLVGEQQRCPKCKKKTLKKVAEQTLRIAGGRRRVRRTTYVCTNCGHTVTRDSDIDDSSGTAAFVAGTILGSGRGGGGGGFSGGSFGGGSTGGGGSTSSW